MTWKRSATIALAIITVIGVASLPDDFSRWVQWFSFLLTEGPRLSIGSVCLIGGIIGLIYVHRTSIRTYWNAVVAWMNVPPPKYGPSSIQDLIRFSVKLPIILLGYGLIMFLPFFLILFLIGLIVDWVSTYLIP